MIEVGGYTTEVELGRGGFGTVYRAMDRTHGRNVALKVLDRFDDAGAQRRFDRERRAMGTLSGHPNIAVVYNSGFTADQRPFIAMELLTGGSLADLLDRRGPLSADEAVEIGVQLCDALAHAHAGGVLHLDMKPENVLLSEFGNVKVVDFGIAALVDDQRTTTILATPAYADPRVLDGESGTTSSDIYGVAATLYTLLSGTAPYASTSGAMETFNRIANDPVPRVERADIPPALADCLERAMAKDPANRPASMVEFRQQLVDSVRAPRPSASPTAAPLPAAPPLVTDPVVPPTVAGKPSTATIAGIGLLALAALLLVGIVAFVVLGGDESNDGERSDGPDTSGVDVSTDPSLAVPTTAAIVVPPSVETVTTIPTSPTVTATTVTPTTVPPTGPVASDPRFSLQTTNGLPDPEVFVVPDGSTDLCLTWRYANFDPGAPFEFGWLIDGVRDESSRSSGTNQGGDQGDFFGCIRNPSGLPVGRYEAVWDVSGANVFTHGIYVGGDRQPVTIGVQNNRSTAVCEVYWSPVGTTTAGLPENTATIPPGGSFETTLPTGRYRTVVRDCSGNTVFEDPDTGFTSDDTLTLVD